MTTLPSSTAEPAKQQQEMVSLRGIPTAHAANVCCEMPTVIFRNTDNAFLVVFLWTTRPCAGAACAGARGVGLDCGAAGSGVGARLLRAVRFLPTTRLSHERCFAFDLPFDLSFVFPCCSFTSFARHNPCFNAETAAAAAAFAPAAGGVCL